MPIFKLTPESFVSIQEDGKAKSLLSTAAAASFNAKLLGLGDISQAAKATDAIAAVFDLEGFTTFCKQIEPHLSVPLFLSKFLTWLMDDLKSEMIAQTYENGVRLWCSLPFLAKFMGDGLIVLWDSSTMTPITRRNVIVSAKAVCSHYQSNFLPTMKSKVVDPPPRLRCGIARGSVYTVGDGNDYVGACINMAARLQKLPAATFAVNIRGFEIDDPAAGKFFLETLVVKKVAVRGIGDAELVGILKAEFVAMTKGDSKLYKDV